MADYCIQKITKAGEWVPAFGLKAKSYPKAASDAEASRQFDEITKNCRTAYRLIKWGGFGYNVQVNVIKELNR